MNSNAILIAIGVVAGGALLVVLSMWSRAQALDALRRWAAAEGLELGSATRRLVVLGKRKAVNLHELIVKDGDSGRSEENEVQETKGSFDPGGTQSQDWPGNHLYEHILGDQNQPNNPIGSWK